MKDKGLTERRLTRPENWPEYAKGMLTETGFILVLTLLALGMAVLAKAVF